MWPSTSSTRPIAGAYGPRHTAPPPIGPWWVSWPLAMELALVFCLFLLVLRRRSVGIEETNFDASACGCAAMAMAERGDGVQVSWE
ncbi:hypothetical protein SDJN02_15862, partial [Cucurbita argyrosperma subsp. argyrosperma]